MIWEEPPQTWDLLVWIGRDPAAARRGSEWAVEVADRLVDHPRLEEEWRLAAVYCDGVADGLEAA